MKEIMTIILSLFPLIGVAAEQPKNARPNVLFIAVDDLNACVEGMNGETTVHTPNISRHAKKGVFFTNVEAI